ncbi:FecR domain-containing protein [Nitrincola sp. MINF-07-Sa-05]|uniref:FecR domain-containing protein n=1 Tax=Nitrincola salilacus TaxID=3400273 RepID=UPI003917F94C
MQRLICQFIFLYLLFFTQLAIASVGNISLLYGDASILRDRVAIEATTGSPLNERDTLVTAQGARAQISLNDGTVISLGGNAEFRVDEFVNTELDTALTLNIAQGTFKAISGRIARQSPERFRLNTRTATVGIRGTIIVGKVTPDFELFVTIRGQIFVIENLTGAQVDVPAGQFTRVVQGFPPTQPEDLTQGIANELATDVDQPPPAASQLSGVIRASGAGLQASSDTEGGVQASESGVMSMSVGQPAQLMSMTANPALADQALAEQSTDQQSETLPGGSDDSPLAPSEPEPGSGPLPGDDDLTPVEPPELTQEELLEKYLVFRYSYYSSAFQNVSFYPPVTELPGPDDNYSVWDYWVGGTWVAGPKTEDTLSHINNLIGSQAVYTYNGQAIGHVYQGFSDPVYTIPLDSFNNTQITFDFGTGVHSGTMQFLSSGAGGFWNVLLSGGTVFPSANFTFGLYDSTFNVPGTMSGTFFGPDAESIGAFFNLLDSANQIQALGVIRAER